MTDDFKISMHRLNPTHKVNDEVFMGFFPPNKNYYSELLKNERFKLFLMSDSYYKRRTGQNCRLLPSWRIVGTNGQKKMFI